jgi:hypothetical protein
VENIILHFVVSLTGEEILYVENIIMHFVVSLTGEEIRGTNVKRRASQIITQNKGCVGKHTQRRTLAATEKPE